MINNIVIIGTGNVAWHLGNVFNKNGVSIVHIAGHKLENAQKLAEELTCQNYSSLDFQLPQADAYLVAVSDDFIRETAKKINTENKFLIHASGSLAADCLKFDGNKYGVLNPLQSLTRYKEVEFKKIPFCISASDKEAEQEITSLAKRISDTVVVCTDEERSALHLCAVWVNNFTNHLYDIANEILKEKNLPFELLLPLIEETVNKIKTITPAQAQTGPARRGDFSTIVKHKNMLKNHEPWQELYQELTDSIIHNI